MSRTNPLTWAILITLVFAAVQLPFAGFMADDYMQIGVLEGISPATWLGPFDLYTLADGNPDHMRILKDTGAFQWFWQPDFKLTSFRPLSSLLLALDHSLFGTNPLGYAITNILWFFTFIMAVALLYKKFLTGSLLTLTIIIFSVSGIHWQGMYWIASRHIIIAASLGIWSLLAYIKYREQQWAAGLYLSIFASILALMAGETGVAALIFLILYEFCYSTAITKEKFIKLIPFGVLLILYLGFYLKMGYGAQGGSGYLNPFSDPLQFLLALPLRLITSAGSMFLGGHTELWMIRSIRPYAVLGAMLAIILIFIILRRILAILDEKQRAIIKWLISASALSLIIFSTASPGTRFLGLPFIGGCLIISTILHTWWQVIRKSSGNKIKTIGMVCWTLVVVHLFFAPLQRLAAPLFAKTLFADRLGKTLQPITSDAGPLPEKIVLINAPDFSIGLHSYYYLKLKQFSMPKSWWVLSWENCPHRIHRISENTIKLELLDGWIESPFIKTGTRVELTGMTVTVLDADSRVATKIKFEFDRTLDDPSLKFYAYLDKQIKQISLPAIGESFLITR